MTDQQFGVTQEGFVIKGIDRIIADQQARARIMFGDDVNLDLSSGSALRKVIDAVAWEAQELWRSLEGQYYANFVTTATGPSLDLLGTDLGIARRNLQAAGKVTLTLSNNPPGRSYVLPEGAVIRVVAGTPVLFRTTDPVTMGAHTVATVGVQAVQRGPGSNLAANHSLELDPAWATLHLNLGAATIKAANIQAISGGELLEADSDFRARLIGLPRALWTQDALLAAILDLDGVRDATIFDPLGGVDVSQSYFNMFLFGQRAFALERQVGSPYYFDVVVAVEPGWPWLTSAGSIAGVYDGVLDVVKQWRPVSIFPNIVEANQVDVGLRATLVVQPGHDPDAIKGQMIDSLHTRVNNLQLGRQVRYSDAMLLARSASGVVDVQNLHLRRCPPAFGGINFSGGFFDQSVELAVGENLTLGPDEIAIFTVDSTLSDIQVVNQ
ncbi:baseplate J/gp47 family protein [Mycobacterium sp.]|uniref:baseplate J/gp47 family protein n=1 Tax=Mycobacterium sp. TaxID=1785 RepID=UPI003D13C1D2